VGRTDSFWKPSFLMNAARSERELALQSGVRNVSLGSVAAAVGLAKSNVARYFGTREEIYLELAAEEWKDWESAVIERLRDATGLDDVIAALAETIEARPLVCDLHGRRPCELIRSSHGRRLSPETAGEDRR
jgi:AcrR family transcriptional regulator